MKRILIVSALLLAISLPGWATAAPGQADGQPGEARSLTIDEMNKFTVKQGLLYWNNTLVKTEQTIDLDREPMIVAWIAAGTALLTAILNLLRFCGYGNK